MVKKEEGKELAVISDIKPTIQAYYYSYQDVERMALAISKSGLFGLKTPDQALALMLVAQADGLHPAIAARDYDIIQGRPAKKAEAMLRSFIKSGGSVVWHKLDDKGAEATFSHPQGGKVRISFGEKEAQAAGLLEKEMYKKYPRQMYRSRCTSEGVRTVYPGATGGMYVPEEVQDFDDKPKTIETTASTMPENRAETPVSAPQVSGADGSVILQPTSLGPPKEKDGTTWWSLMDLTTGKYHVCDGDIADTVARAINEKKNLEVTFRTSGKGNKILKTAFVVVPIDDRKPVEVKKPEPGLSILVENVQVKEENGEKSWIITTADSEQYFVRKSAVAARLVMAKGSGKVEQVIVAGGEILSFVKS